MSIFQFEQETSVSEAHDGSMPEVSLDQQTNLFLYDLMNEAKEHGFKADEQWTITMATLEERASIQKNYRPSVAVKLNPAELLVVSQQAKTRLKQSIKPEGDPAHIRDIIRNNYKYLVAYNPKRTRS